MSYIDFNERNVPVLDVVQNVLRKYKLVTLHPTLFLTVHVLLVRKICSPPQTALMARSNAWLLVHVKSYMIPDEEIFSTKQIPVSRSLDALQMTLILRSDEGSKYRAKYILKIPKWYIIRRTDNTNTMIKIKDRKTNNGPQYTEKKQRLSNKYPTKNQRCTGVQQACSTITTSHVTVKGHI